MTYKSVYVYVFLTRTCNTPTNTQTLPFVKRFKFVTFFSLFRLPSCSFSKIVHLNTFDVCFTIQFCQTFFFFCLFHNSCFGRHFSAFCPYPRLIQFFIFIRTKVVFFRRFHNFFYTLKFLLFEFLILKFFFSFI